MTTYQKLQRLTKSFDADTQILEAWNDSDVMVRREKTRKEIAELAMHLVRDSDAIVDK